jgi:hypothetical protein
MDLTPKQAATVCDAVRKRAAFFHAVQVRMYRLGVRPGDELYDRFAEAEEVLRRLATQLHNRSIIRGDRRPWEADDSGHTAGGAPAA